MKIEGIVWLRDVVAKLALKHHVIYKKTKEVLILSARVMARKERDRESARKNHSRYG